MSVINNPGLTNPSPALTGTPTAPTAAPGTNTTQIATTAFADAAATAAAADTLNVNGVAVVSPFSFTALVNGIGPVGETKINGFPAANYQPCMVENPALPGNMGLVARSANAIYCNTSPYPMLVMASISGSSFGSNSTTAGSVGATPAVGTTVWGHVASNNASARGKAIFFVPPGQYYKIVVTTGGTAVVSMWREYLCVTGTWSDSGDIVSSPGRSLSTVYQNNSANTLFVVAQLSSVANGGTSPKGLSDASTTPTNLVDNPVQDSGTTGLSTVFMIVPPYHYYEVTSASGSLSHWHEYTWNIPCTKSNNLVGAESGLILLGRTAIGLAALQVATQNGPVSMNVPVMWKNEPFRVRWVQVINANSNASGSASQMWAGDGIPPYLVGDYNWTNTASISRMLRGPVMPDKFYFVFDQQSSTVTQTSWFEYQLG